MDGYLGLGVATGGVGWSWPAVGVTRGVGTSLGLLVECAVGPPVGCAIGGPVGCAPGGLAGWFCRAALAACSERSS